MNDVLEGLTDLDKRIVVALQSNGRASWRTVAEAVGSSTATVARRGQQLIADGVVRVAVVPVLAAGGPFASFWARITCAPGRAMEVAEELVRNPAVRFCAVVAGEYDIVAELVLRGNAATYSSMLGAVQDIAGIDRWRSDITLHVYKVSFDWGRQLYGEMSAPEQEDAVGSAEPADCTPQHFDDADRQILERLAVDGRETFQQIADGMGFNESSVRRRYERMRANRCLDVLTLVQSAALGMGAETLVQVTVEPSRLDVVAKELATYPFVRYLALMLDENSLLCELITPSTQDLHAFMTGPLSHLDGVQGWSASMELLFLKRGFVETPWWRAQAAPA